MRDSFKPERHRIVTSLGMAAIAWLLCASMLLLSAQTRPSPKPLTKDDVVKLLNGNVPAKRVEALVRERGIDFQITSEAESELRKAGASDSLLATLRELAPKPATLVVTTTPGGAQVFVDDELIARTSAEGRLKISTLAAGPHKLRVSLDGYRDHEESVDLVAGETLGVPIPLEPNLSAMLPAPHGEVGATGGNSSHGSAGSTLTFPGKLIHGLGSWGQWRATGTMTLANGKLRFAAKNDEKHFLDLYLTDVSPLNQGHGVVIFDTRVPDDKKERCWFFVQANGKNRDANQAAAKQLYEALKAGSK